MTDRMVVMNADQAAEIDLLIERLMREKETERAASMMILALAYKFATEPALPENVYPIVQHAGDNWSRKPW